ncbi:MAG: hypothetical protein JJU02_09990 [Cryomorphaceae bacterium]|nr:hypothetical protein [Cryomorphaceae bacterium]
MQSEEFKTIIYRPDNEAVTESDRRSTVEVPQELRRSSVEVQNLLKVLNSEMSRKDIQRALQLKHEGNFRDNYLEPAIEDGYIKMKYPDSPNHPKQRYLLTEKGIEALKKHI